MESRTQTLVAVPLLSPELQPRPIVCWEAGDRRLYAEVIQSIPERGTCWVRPLMLVEGAGVIDLRVAPDLVWSAAPFRQALDVEAVPLLTELPPTPELSCAPQARWQLNQFLRQAWAE